ncbi:MAG: hypothetical protein COV70_00440 [Parcubacteria group bacterium CG11_big_fil_rev_8_21_14_0_20_39_22]|nr:MAG: hypothetical protein COV70_00440 [Parcubacteria group bacterium CG11_big_fil_rev_8_21_14_0_20_39_22]
MPLINLEYDNASVSDAEAEAISKSVRDIVSETTGIADVFVYANTARVKIQIAPIEIFLRMTGKKIQNRKELVSAIKKKLTLWKSENNFKHPINLTLIPMDWNVEIGI